MKQITETAPNDKVRTPALKGFTKFIALDGSLTDVEKVEMYEISLKYAKSSNEKNIALDGVGQLKCFESLETIKLYVNQEDVKKTVDDGINRVSSRIYQKEPERVKEYILWSLSKIKDENFQKRNTQLLERIDQYIKERDTTK